ncbi:MAG: aldehyde:ferredoxin oxidoreductase [Nitrospirae bacterium]|nr:aldehyde:ferredoxin oxidoreductase [Nitrospirota bacterium]
MVAWLWRRSLLDSSSIRVLYIDLGQRTYRVEDREDLFKDFLGGVGVGAKLLEENLLPKEDPYHPDQPIILSNGTLCTIFPVISKVVAMFKSPLTGELGESYAGGRLGFAMRFGGVDAIVIKGRSEDPIYLNITDYKVSFKGAEPIWGLTTEDVGWAIRDAEPGKGHRSIIRIGPAGMKRVAFACVNVDTYRHFGRLGLGAVMGSKNLIGVYILANRHYPSGHLKNNYNKVYNKIYKRITQTDEMRKYHEFGTAVNVIPLNEFRALPTRNLLSTTFEKAEGISGETFAKETLIRKVSCIGCPIGCIHIGLLRREFAPQEEYESMGLSYDYELIFALGSLLGIGTTHEVLTIIEKIEDLSLDSIAAGAFLSWVTEAYQRGIVSKDDLGTEIGFGQTENYLMILNNLIRQQNDFYKEASKGPWHLSERYGGKDFSVTLGKNPIAGYHTGYGSLIGQAVVGARHSHVDNAGYSIDQKRVNLTPKELVGKLVAEEKERNILNIAGVCMFARSIYNRELIQEALASIGIERSLEELGEMAERVFRLKLKLKKEMGFRADEVYFPKRFFETESMNGLLKEEVAREMVSAYKEIIATC